MASSDLINNPNADTIFNPLTHKQNLTNTFNDYKNSGQSLYQIQGPGLSNTAWGGDPNLAAMNSGHNTAMGDQTQMQASGAYDRMMQGPGQSVEDRGLNDAYRENRYGDQAGAMGLMRDAAMGNAPSFAQMQQRQGLDQAMASQQAIAGAARGPGALALAGGQMAGNTAMLQQQGAMNSSMLRAQEMAQARGAYGDMSNQVGAQTLNRMQLNNQVGMNNANNANTYGLGVGQVGASYGNTGLGYAKNAQDPYSQQLTADTSTNNARAGLDTEVELAKQKQEAANRANGQASTMNFFKGIGGIVGSVIGGAKGG